MVETEEEWEHAEDAITYKDVYRQLWDCRNFEVQHYWQRAVFVATFLTTCFVAYGCWFVSDSTESIKYHVVALAISLIGAMISFFWLLMMKASKRWYEHYEKSLDSFLRFKHQFIDKRLCGIAGLQCNRINPDEVVSVTSNPFDSRPGLFSPSRINSEIGLFTFLIWSVLIVGHLFALLLAQAQISTVRSVLAKHCGICAFVMVGLTIAYGLSAYRRMRSSNTEGTDSGRKE